MANNTMDGYEQELRVLLVEDSEDDALLVTRALKKGGYIVRGERVYSAAAMGEALSQKEWDLVISDHIMPSFSAPEALEILKGSGLDLPFIIVSGNIGEGVAVEAMRAGANDYIMKGNLSRLAPAVRRELKEARMRRDKRKAEEALSRERDLVNRVMETSPAGILLVDKGGRITLANARAQEILGLAGEELLGQPFNQLAWQGDTRDGYPLREQERAFWQVMRTKKELYGYNEIIESPGGEKVYLVINAAPLWDPQGQMDGVVFALNDVTRLKEAERARQEDLEKARQIHRQLLPDWLPGVEDIEMAASYQEGERPGGDLYGVIAQGDRLVLYLIDVSLEGLDGVMISSCLKNLLQEYVTRARDSQGLQPRSIMDYLVQEYQRRQYPEGSYISIFLGVLDVQAREFSYLGCGIPGACLVVMPVDGTGVCRVLGGEECPASPAIPWESRPTRPGLLEIKPGAALILTTRGLALEKSGEEKYARRFKELFQDIYYLPPELIIRLVEEDFYNFTGGRPARDDFVLLSLHSGVTRESMSLKLKSDFQEIRNAKEEVYSFISSFQPSYPCDLFGFLELLTNAIEHGNKQDYAKDIQVEISLTDRYLKIAVQDQGEGFDWRKKIKNEIDLNNFNERGRGIIMTRMMSDYLYYNHQGNRVTLVDLLDKYQATAKNPGSPQEFSKRKNSRDQT